jgi:hypothetical protein
VIIKDHLPFCDKEMFIAKSLPQTETGKQVWTVRKCQVLYVKKLFQLSKTMWKVKKIHWNLYKAEPHGTENIFHIGQVSALYKIAKKKC